MKRILIVPALMALLCWIGAAVAKSPETVDLWLTADITIDASGRMTSLAWRDKTALHALAAERIENRVRAWEFEPAKVDGRPVDTRTGLSIHLVAMDHPSGGATLRFRGANTGPWSEALLAPKYPENAARGNAHALVTAVLDVGTDGKPTIVSLEVESSSRNHGKAFEKASEAAIESWRFHPEVVAGQAVRTRVTVPITFCVEPSRWCQNMARTRGPNAPPAGEPIALDSAVVLKTDVADSEI
jgi:TonB family protein